MKNILLMIGLVIMSVLGFSQSNTVYNMYKPGYSTVTTQTVTNTTPDTAYISTQYNYESVTIQALAVKVTGTLTATERVEVSIDGSNWVSIPDTATLTAATTSSYHWLIKNNPFKYYRVIIKASTSNTSTFRAFIMPNGKTFPANVRTMTQATGASRDTVDNTGTGYVTYHVQSDYSNISIQFVGTKISGTVAGTVTLQGSLDGTNFETVKTSNIVNYTNKISSYDGAATFTATDGTSSKIWVIKGNPYAYYRLSWTGTGTMSGIIRGYLLTNK